MVIIVTGSKFLLNFCPVGQFHETYLNICSSQYAQPKNMESFNKSSEKFREVKFSSEFLPNWPGLPIVQWEPMHRNLPLDQYKILQTNNFLSYIQTSI